MERYQVEPLVGIGPVRLGMTKEEVHAAMGNNFESFIKAGTTLCHAYYESCFQIFYSNEDSRVEFIEVSREIETPVFYREIEVFNTKVPDLISLIERDSPYDKNHWELGYSFIFPELALSLWRPLIPNAELPLWRPDEPVDSEAEEDEEEYYFETIGVGVPGCFHK